MACMLIVLFFGSILNNSLIKFPVIEKDDEYVLEPDLPMNVDHYPGYEQKKKIVDFYRSGKKLKTLKQMRHRFGKINSITTVRNYEAMIERG